MFALSLLATAVVLCEQLGLLTNDGLTLPTMEGHGLSKLARVRRLPGSGLEAEGDLVIVTDGNGIQMKNAGSRLPAFSLASLRDRSSAHHRTL